MVKVMSFILYLYLRNKIEKNNQNNKKNYSGLDSFSFAIRNEDEPNKPNAN
jgi:hypothetical protein